MAAGRYNRVMRRWRLPALLLITLVLTLWPGSLDPYAFTGEESLPGQVRGSAQWLHSAIRPQPELAPEATPLVVAPSPFGVNTFLEQEVLPEVRDESLRRVREAGFGIIRQEFPWEDIEIHGKGDFVDRRNPEVGEISAWAKYDDIVAAAERHDLAILARLSNAPAWAHPSDPVTHAPPDNPADFGDFVAAVVGRYRGRIGYVQLWNEPNIFPEWGSRVPDPVAFTELLCLGYHRAKDANPDVVVVGPALSPTIAFDARDRNTLIYLQRLYLAGAGDCFDVFSAQGYGLFSGPTDRRLLPTLVNFPHHLFVRDLMVQWGDAAKPIWISELGWNAVPAGLPQPFGQVSNATQARYTVEALERAAREWPWVNGINVWFFKRAGIAEQGEPWYYFRLMEPDFTPLPVYEALRDVLSDPDRLAPDPRPAWWYRWPSLRATLALALIALLFFCLLRTLHGAARAPAGAAPHERSTTKSR